MKESSALKKTRVLLTRLKKGALRKHPTNQMLQGSESFLKSN